MGYGIVYRAVNRLSGKLYVGQTIKPLEDRIRGHRKSAKNKKRKMPFGRAIEKYGIEAFDFEAVFVAFDQESLDAAEIALILEFDCRVPSGYNLKLGGEGGVHHPDTIRKIADKMRGRPLSKAHRITLSKAHLESEVCKLYHESKRGVPLREEHKTKTSATLKGRQKNPDHQAKITAALQEYEWPEERRQRTADMCRDPGHIEKVARANRGQKRSAASKERMRVAALAAWRRKKDASVTANT